MPENLENSAVSTELEKVSFHSNSKERQCQGMLKIEVSQPCPTLWDPKDYSLPGFSVHGIFQARIPEWVAIPFSRGSSQRRDQTQVSHIVGRHFTLWATREAQECSNYHTIALISHASKVIPKFSKPSFNSTWTKNLQMFKLVLGKAEEPKIKLPTSIGS